MDRKSLGAYYDDAKLKSQILHGLNHMAIHGKYDPMSYWNADGTGCAIGGVLQENYVDDFDRQCALRRRQSFEGVLQENYVDDFDSVYRQFEDKTNIPYAAAWIFEDIFTQPQVSTKHSKFPTDFMSAIPVGFKEWDILYKLVCKAYLNKIVLAAKSLGHSTLPCYDDMTMMAKRLSGIPISGDLDQILDLVMDNMPHDYVIADVFPTLGFYLEKLTQGKLDYMALSKSITDEMAVKLAPLEIEVERQ